MKEITPTYYIIKDYPSGFSISDNYSSFCAIYDQDKIEIREHYLADKYWGKWRKTLSLLKKWEKACVKAGLVKYY